MVFVLHRGGMAEFLPLATQVAQAHQREGRPGSERSRAGQAHPEDHQRQDPAAPAGRELRRGRVRRGARGAGARCAPRSAGRNRSSLLGDRGQAQDDLRRGARGQARRPPRQPVRDRRQLAEADRDPRADRSGISRAWWISPSCSISRRSPSWPGIWRPSWPPEAAELAVRRSDHLYSRENGRARPVLRPFSGPFCAELCL